VALEYVRKGAHVTIAARNQKLLDTAKEQLNAARVHETQIVSTVAVDVSAGLAEVEAAFEPAMKTAGDVHTIINSAGIFFAREFTKVHQHEFENMMKVNVLGSIYATRAVVGGMIRQGEGRIVFVASQVAHVAIYGYSAYAASKWALRGLAESLQMELRPHNILVSVAYPPDTDTPGYKVEMMDKPEITKKLSESGVFSPESVAKDIVCYATKGYFGISNGFDGWMLKQLHPGMSPINNIWEVAQQIIFSGLFRLVSLLYVLNWDSIIAKETKMGKNESDKDNLLPADSSGGNNKRDKTSKKGKSASSSNSK
jgi:3-dehydrosphinganine reductase